VTGPSKVRSPGEVVRAYFSDCSTSSAEAIAAFFTPDAVVYDTNHPPVVGAEAIGRFWVGVRERWGGATWSVDSLLEGPDAVAMEWTMRGERHGRPFAAHGSDHYRIERGLIAEVRQYWVLDRTRADTGLVDYPYGTG
jgi:ketosteroid isomerase-like protein